MPAGVANPSGPEPQLSPPRREELERLIADTIEARGVRDPRVIDAMRRIERHCFVPNAVARSAYSDYPLPIGHGQTISQPYIVALMTEAGINGSLERCLEIGTGCGYQTAILSLLCREVFSVEVVDDLFAQSQRNLAAAGCLSECVHLRLGDGFHGWPEYAPFNLIVVTAAPPRVPPPLLAQLAIGGRLIVPVGSEHGIQQLQRWTREGQGAGGEAFRVEDLLEVRFVPMVGTIRNV
jgi:protein-L-isoaspartate(D-aspartate) O-methyltransferase